LWNMTKAMNVLYSVRVLQSLYRFQPYDCVIIRFVEWIQFTVKCC